MRRTSRPSVSGWMIGTSSIKRDQGGYRVLHRNIFVFATAIDFIAINFDPVHSEYLSSYPNCPLSSSVWPNLSIHKTDEVSDIKLNISTADGGMCLYWLYIL